MLNPTQLRTLVAVLSEGSFTDAAASLGYTASAVSQQISALERASGLMLFERLPRSVQPTAAAHYLADASREIVLALRSLEHDSKALAAGERGEIRLGSFPTATARIVPTALVTFNAAHPDVEVHLDEGEPDALLPVLLDGPLDIALVFESEYDRHGWPTSLVTVPLMIEQRLLLLPPGHRRSAGGKPVQLRDLRKTTWVGTEETPNLEQLCASVGFDPHVTFRSDNYGAVCAFVRAGLGAALVPELGYEPSPDIPPLRLKPDPPERHIHALYRRSNRNPLIPALLKTLESVANAIVPVLPPLASHR